MLYSTDLEVILPIINSIGAPVFLIDVLENGSFRYFAFNRHEENDIGLTTAQVSGKQPEELVSPDFAQHLIENYQRCVDAQAEIEIETYLDTPTGRRWAHNRLTPIFDEKGRFVRIMGTVIEITEQRRAEMLLTESERKYRALFDRSLEAIIIVNPQGAIIDINPAGLDLFGYTSEELIGQSTAILYADISDRTGIRERLAKEGYIREEEVSIRRKDGTVRIGRFTATQLMDEDELPYLQFTTVHDITSKKLAEDTLQFVAGHRSTSDSFFDELILHLVTNLGVCYAFIGKLGDDGESIQTVSLYDRGSLQPNMSYALRHTPCEDVVGKNLCYHPRHIQTLFPQDTLLVELNLESYMGMPLWKTDGNPLGIIVLIDNKPLPSPQLAETLLQLVAVRAAHELERQQDEQRLKASEARYRAIVETQTEFIARSTPDGTMLFVNHAYSQYFSLSPDALIGSNFFPVIAPEDR
ncbi:MAG TPA: PAS domain S-box protein, partial [Aggregatilineales bacterium]|nr:PAS domain S-box protein [Aggregatilineales bacterium]